MSVTERIKVTFYTFDKDITRIIRQMHKDGLAYECPIGEFHLIYPLEEYGHQILVRRRP